MPHRALITGVSGFAGGFLAEHLLDGGDAVLGSSIAGKWEPSSSAQLAGRVELVAWDIGSAQGIAAEARRRIEDFRVEVIYHLAALSVPEDCGPREPLPLATAVNVEGTRRVLELAASLAKMPRVLLTSTSHVYAPVTPRAPLVAETAPLGPRGGYGRTKLAAEAEVRRAIERDACDVVIARSFQHTGPRQGPRMMLPSWARQFAAGGSEPVEVHTCDARIDVADVRDVVRAYRLLAERGEPATVYNVGSGKSRRSGEVLQLLQNLADPQRGIVETRPGPKQDPIANTERLHRCTGWRATISLEKTVSDTWEWWKGTAARSTQG